MFQDVISNTLPSLSTNLPLRIKVLGIKAEHFTVTLNRQSQAAFGYLLGLRHTPRPLELPTVCKLRNPGEQMCSIGTTRDHFWCAQPKTAPLTNPHRVHRGITNY